VNPPAPSPGTRFRQLPALVRTGLIPFLAVWTLAVWLGGFTFHSAVVIPALHDQLGSPLETGLVTQAVTVTLNRIGLLAVALGAAAALAEPRRRRPRYRSRRSLVLLALTAIALASLFVLHGMLDLRLDAGQLTGFYPIHRRYLWVSTFQWLINSALLASWALSGGED
jgi:hypothetical protein